MFLLLLLLAASPASAAANHEVLLTLAVVDTLGQDHPWGVRLSGTDLLAFGYCLGYQVPPGCPARSGFPRSLWPVAGPELALEWHGGRRTVVQVDGVAGVASLDTVTVGFEAFFEAMAMAGGRWELANRGAMVVLGGTAAKSLSGQFVVPKGNHWFNGDDWNAVRVGAEGGWDVGTGWTTPTLWLGLQSNTYEIEQD